MAKKLDPRLIEILTQYGEDPNEALWDCHGTWVAYHKAIERIAAKAGVTFEMPQIVEASSANKTVAIAVRGFMGDRSEWSFGEASPANNKNAYPFAMAEKRSKDRVVLKLIGLHGLVFSEEESDDFKPTPSTTPPKQVTSSGWMADEQPNDAPTKSSAQLKRDNFWPDFERELFECTTLVMLEKFKAVWRDKAIADGWNASFKYAARDRIEGHEKAIIEAMDDEEQAGIPLDKALKHSLAQHPANSG